MPGRLRAAQAAMVLACILSVECWAAELSREQAATIYALAWGLMGYSPANVPAVPPEVRIAAQTKLREMACSGAPCPVRGLQRAGVVWIDESLDFANPRDASVLLHEFVHFLQWAARGEAPDCLEWQAREREAYNIQAYVLDRGGYPTSHLLAAARGVICS